MKGRPCLHISTIFKHTNQASDAYNTPAEHVHLVNVFGWRRPHREWEWKQGSKISLAFTSLPAEWRWQRWQLMSFSWQRLVDSNYDCIIQGAKVLFLARVSLVFEGWSLYSAHRWFGEAMGVAEFHWLKKKVHLCKSEFKRFQEKNINPNTHGSLDFREVWKWEFGQVCGCHWPRRRWRRT